MARLPTRRLLIGAAIAAALAVAFAWLFPSQDYLYVPNTAKPVADRVDVAGEKPDSGPGAIYYVDVTVRRATWAERLVAVPAPRRRHHW